MNFIKKMLSDKRGNVSSMRIVMVLFTAFYLINWAYAVLTTGAFTPSAELTTIVAGIILGKSAQSFSEK